MSILITGGAGFIGQILMAKMKNTKIICVDKDLDRPLKKISNVIYEHCDATNLSHLKELTRKYKITQIMHLAANSDIKNGLLNSEIDFKDTLISSLVISELVKSHNISKLFFASSSAIYGIKDSPILNNHMESCAPISNYGWAKLASELALSWTSKKSGTQFICIRFPNVVGPTATHGVIYDLFNKLLQNKTSLDVLGNGTQSKPYLHVDDLTNIIIKIWKMNKSCTLNVGPEDTISVKDIVEILLEETKLKPNINWGSNEFGWIGDVPHYQFAHDGLAKKLKLDKFSSSVAIRKTVRQLCSKS